jgi:hypothetical protein
MSIGSRGGASVEAEDGRMGIDLCRLGLWGSGEKGLLRASTEAIMADGPVRVEMVRCSTLPRSDDVQVLQCKQMLLLSGNRSMDQQQVTTLHVHWRVRKKGVAMQGPEIRVCSRVTAEKDAEELAPAEDCDQPARVI